jgi:uncharacterized membrane protein
MKGELLLILSIIGFFVSAYILYSKKLNKPLFCPIGENCDYVVRSKYGKTFGIENTIPGIIFYAVIFLYGLVLMLNRNIFKEDIVHYLIVGISIASVLFSLYLVYVQKFILKKWCIYCLVSTAASILILGVLLYNG